MKQLIEINKNRITEILQRSGYSIMTIRVTEINEKIKFQIWTFNAEIGNERLNDIKQELKKIAGYTDLWIRAKTHTDRIKLVVIIDTDLIQIANIDGNPINWQDMTSEKAKKIIKHYRYTYKQIAEKGHISISTVSRIIRSNKELTYKMRHRISYSLLKLQESR